MSDIIKRIPSWLTRDTNEVIQAITRYARQRTSLQTHALSSFVLGSGIVAIYLFARHYEDFEELLMTAVNLGGDTDSIGAMVGTMAGALHGYSAIPVRWCAGLRNHDPIYARAEALARGEGMPAGIPGLREMEVALTQEEASR
jgi:ADP-ribosylglycohydrolase